MPPPTTPAARQLGPGSPCARDVPRRRHEKGEEEALLGVDMTEEQGLSLGVARDHITTLTPLKKEKENGANGTRTRRASVP
jgi:hypothetical protein